MANKQDAIKAIAGKTELTQVAVTKMMNALEEYTHETLEAGDKLQLTGFVTFKPVPRAARKGFDPIKEVAMDIPPTVGVKVSAGEKLKTAVEKLEYKDFAK